MTYPVIMTHAETDITGNTNTHAITTPAGFGVDDLLLGCVLFTNSNPGITYPSGFAQLSFQNNTNRLHAAFWKKANGTEGTSVTISTTASCKSRTTLFRIEGWHGSTIPEAASGSSFGNSANPPNLDPVNWGIEDTLWIAFVTAANTVTGYASNMTGLYDWGSSVTGARVASTNSTTSAFDPGTFSIASSTSWEDTTVAIRPGTAGNDTKAGLGVIWIPSW